jgi:peptidoglycan/LPS O-acetylase OafA/YrhL
VPRDLSLMSFSHTGYLKGIAIVLVVISHIGNYSGHTWFTPLGGIGVAVFLFCSSFGLMRSYKKNGLAGFWKKKFISIYIPFVFVETIAAIVYRVSIKDFLLDILFIKIINPNGWYMQYLLTCYTIFYFGMKYIDNEKARMALWNICAVTSFFMCKNLQGEQCLSFILGIYFEANYVKIKSAKSQKVIYYAISTMTISTIVLGIKQIPAIRAQPSLVITFMNMLIKSGFMLGIVALTSQSIIAPNIFWFFGKISYAWYLIHGYFMWIISNNITGNYMINSFAMIIVSLFLATMLYFAITKMNKGGTYVS